MKIIILALAALALAGCGTTQLSSLTKNRDCTTRISGKGSFGSVTPTGTWSFSAVCKPGSDSPPAATVPAPPEPTT